MSVDPERDAALSRLYRDAAGAQPPARLDAAILAAARAEAGRPARPRTRPWWRRWAIPVSMTALVVLSASLTFLVSREQERAGLRSPPRPAAAPAGEAAVSTDAGAPPAIRRPEAPAAAKPELRRATPPPAARAPAPVQKASPSADGQAFPAPEPRRESAPRPLGAAAEQRGAAAPGSSAGAALPAADADAPPAEPEASSRAMPAKPAAAAADRAKSAPAAREATEEAVGLVPEQWVERIRTLLRQGHQAEAAQALRKMREAYPGYPLPPDLAAIERR